MMSTLQVQYRKKALAVSLHSLRVRLRKITVKRAAELLVMMGRGAEKFWWVSVRDTETRFEWCANQLLNNTTLAECVATSISRIEFYGGPPGCMQLHSGTFLTLLVDRLLMEIHRGGFDGLDAIVPLQENYH